MQKNMQHSLMESLPAVDAYAANHNGSHFSPEQDPPHHLVMNGDALRARGTSAPPYTAIEGDKGFSPRTSDVSSITELEAGEDLTASAPRVDLSASVPSATSSSSISSSSPLLSTYGRWHIAGMLWVGVDSCGQVWALVGGGGLLGMDIPIEAIQTSKNRSTVHYDIFPTTSLAYHTFGVFL